MATKKETNSASKRTPLPLELLERLYSAMLQSRLAEERLRLLASSGKLKAPYASIIGHEATEMGAAAQLKQADTISPSRSGLFSYIAAGSALRPALAPLLGQTATTTGDAAPRLLLPSGNFAARLNIATGIALGSIGVHNEEDDSVVLLFAADSDAAPAAWEQSLALASAQRLPILYVYENTRWVNEAKSSGKISAISKTALLMAAAEQNAIPSITVDGNDAVAVYRVVHEALHRARLRHGATFINALVWPWRRNSATDAARPRTAAEIEHWQGRDPLAHMELYMSWYGIWSNEWKQQQVEKFQRDLDDALKPLPKVKKSAKKRK